MSTHSVDIIEIAEVLPHPNADRMELVKIGGWTACVGKEQFKVGDRAVYIQPDYIVPTDRDEFAFLAKEGRNEHRIRTVRLRGVVSFGLLIRVPEELRDLPTGANVMEHFAIRRWEPPVESFKPAEADTLAHDLWPQVYNPKFDVENFNNYPELIGPDEWVVITEKVHGANAKCVWHNDQFYIGSRNRWLKTEVSSLYTRAMAPAFGNEALADWCRAHPDTVLYGEVYGPVQSLRYGLREPRFLAFAAQRNDDWANTQELFDSLVGASVPHAPVLFSGHLSDWMTKVAAGALEIDSLVAEWHDAKGQIMEGAVITPAIERRDLTLGRVALKLISNRYWES